MKLIIKYKDIKSLQDNKTETLKFLLTDLYCVLLNDESTSARIETLKTIEKYYHSEKVVIKKIKKKHICRINSVLHSYKVLKYSFK